MTYGVSDLSAIMLKKGYRVFAEDNLRYNLNLVGVRSQKTVPGSFDDWLCVFWKFIGQWNILKFPITTDPGSYWLKNPMNVKGCAIVKEGQYRNLWKLGKHRGEYDALVQHGNITVIRDANKDNVLNFGEDSEDTGNGFGINLHRAMPRGTTEVVDKWSAGCQVFANAEDFELFMNLARKAADFWGDGFTYTLLSERDFGVA